MKNKLFVYFSLTTIFFSGWVTLNQVSAQLPVNRSSDNMNNPRYESQTREDKLILQIADLEVKHVLLSSRYLLNSPEVESVNQQLQNLRKQLVQVQPNKTMQLNTAIAKAIKTKIAELEVERGIKGAYYIIQSPVIQTIENDIKSLRKRFAQIQPRNSQAVINSAASQSIKIKIAELKAENARLRNIYTSTNVNILTINEQILQLEKRLAMLTTTFGSITK
ncbi:MAG: hypothetical protein KME29_35560 [Calothrix sp. FI2-JRJ7]|jgi:hypothetical protein|nr:hypothetical protein [Calothrix sp. FI2-JRJ7]